MAFQIHVVRPLTVRCETSSPLATAVEPSGTSTRKTYVALSVGTSLTGYHVEAASGSLATSAPSGVDTQPYGAPVLSIGTPVVPASWAGTVVRLP